MSATKHELPDMNKLVIMAAEFDRSQSEINHLRALNAELLEALANLLNVLTGQHNPEDLSRAIAQGIRIADKARN